MICLVLYALFVLVGSCWAAASKNYGTSEGKDGRGANEVLPLVIYFLTNGAVITAASAGVCLLSMLSAGVVYVFSQYT